MSSAGILDLPITSLPVDNFHDRALWCKSTGVNYNMHGWILCRYCATGWFWWISGLRAVTMWSSSSFTKRVSRFWELTFTTQGQVIIWNNVGILLIGPLGTIQWNFNLNLYVFIQEDAFENAGCEMAAILSRSECHGVKVDLQFSCTRIITIRPPFSDDIFKSIILNTNLFLNVQLTMSQLVQIVSWRWRGDKPLPEPMLTKIYDGIWRQWVS